jgi:hypothetical protein
LSPSSSINHSGSKTSSLGISHQPPATSHLWRTRLSATCPCFDRPPLVFTYHDLTVSESFHHRHFSFLTCALLPLTACCN